MFKKSKTAFLLLLTLAFTSVGLGLASQKVSAACGVSTDYGIAASTVAIPQAGSYKLWFRIKPASSTNNAAYVQVDNGSCYKIGDNPALAAGNWVWVNYGQTGSTQTPITVTFTAGNHTLTIVGSEPGVEIDRTILLSSSESCVPSNQKSGSSNPGDNCLTTTTNTGSQTGGTGSGSSNNGGGTVVATTASGAPIRAVSNNSTVTGDVVFNPAIVNDNSVQRVEYYEAGKLIYTSTDIPFHLDTSVLSDGTHTITEKAIYKDGHSQETTSTITVNNHGSAVTAKKKSNWLMVVGIISLILAGLGALIFFNPTVKQFIANRISRITGRAARF